MPHLLRAAIYARYSTDLQSDASVEDQIRSCQDLAKSLGAEVVATYSDHAVSGASLMRQGIRSLLRDNASGTFNLVLALLLFGPLLFALLRDASMPPPSAHMPARSPHTASHTSHGFGPARPLHEVARHATAVGAGRRCASNGALPHAHAHPASPPCSPLLARPRPRHAPILNALPSSTRSHPRRAAVLDALTRIRRLLTGGRISKFISRMLLFLLIRKPNVIY